VVANPSRTSLRSPPARREVGLSRGHRLEDRISVVYLSPAPEPSPRFKSDRPPTGRWARKLSVLPEADRSYERVTRDDLARLAAIARDDREARLARRPRWSPYADRVLCVALCQGAALHYVDERNGVKDFDVYTFYAEHPTGPFPFRWRTEVDFGPSRFGRFPGDPDSFRGRRVDLIGRSLDVPPSADPVDAVRRYLAAGRTETARQLAMKAVVLVEPEDLRGEIIWPPARSESPNTTDEKQVSQAKTPAASTEAGETPLEKLERLGVRGILRQLARDGQIGDVRCEMPQCYCFRGRKYFEPRSTLSEWSPTADHYPRLKMHGGHLTPDNVRLAHKLCNQRDYIWRKKINALLGKRMSLEEIAEKLNAEKVPTIHGTNRWTAASVRKAFVS
jgi:hypothetical protein